jgi:hypothetical protein
MVRVGLIGLLGLALGVSCTSKGPAPEAAHEEVKEAGATPVLTAPSKAADTKDAAAAPVAAPSLADYLRANAPKQATIEGDPPKILHTVAPGETYDAIAGAYLNLTEIYAVKDLARAIEKSNAALVVGKKIEIPKPLTKVPLDPKKEILGWPEDGALRAIFLTGPAAQQKWEDYLEHIVTHGMNAVVLDGKDYQGPVNYPTKAKLAIELKAAEKAVIPDLARMIRFAHWKGVRIILRIPCFHDPYADKRLKDSRLSLIRTTTNLPVHIDWIDPTKEESQQYAMDLAQEGVDAGADEIQLDYVRFPVHISNDFAKLPEPKDRPAVIRDFVRKVKGITQPNGVKLSLDLFGVAATGIRSDIERLGQDIAVVGAEADAISPMVYPSHYDKGYNGWEHPGDHPEIVGIGTKGAVAQLAAVGSKTVVRSWIQAFPWHCNVFSPSYIVSQTKSAEANGGRGWLLWSPSCEYGYAWQGYAVSSATSSAKK